MFENPTQQIEFPYSYTLVLNNIVVENFHCKKDFTKGLQSFDASE